MAAHISSFEELASFILPILETLNNEDDIYMSSSGNDIMILATVLRKVKRIDSVRILQFFEGTVPLYQPSTFCHRFKMSLESFNVIVEELKQYQEMKRTNVGGRAAVPVDKALAVLLWIMGNNETMDVAAERFNLSISTVHHYVHKLIDIVTTNLVPKFIKWPTTEERRAIADSFEQKQAFPGIIGAIDGCHIAIKCPNEFPERYINRKCFHSLVLQAICDNNMNFIHCVVGWPGSVHDARVMRNTFAHTAEQKCSPDYHVIGDSAYPINWWLMTPFKDNGHLTASQLKYNFCQSSSRMVIERAFGLLKGRFPIMKYVQWSNLEEICKLIMTACVFSNICLLHEDDVEQFLSADIEVDPNMMENILPNNTVGIRKRANIAELLSS